MKKYIGIVALFILLMIFVPAVALLGQGSPQSDGNTASGQDNSPWFLSLFQGTSSQGGSSSVDASSLSYKLLNTATGEVVTLSAADYIKGVVAAEMPASYHEEALKAQAVAAHTYALRIIGSQLANPSEELKGAYFSTDPDKFQAYMSKEQAKAYYGDQFDVYWKKISDAVDSVIGKVAVYDGQPIAAAFHAISCGTTENAKNVWGNEVAYLQPVDSPGDKLSPQYEADKTLTAEEVKQALTEQNSSLNLGEDKAAWFSDLKTTESGTVSQITVGDSTMTGLELRNLLDLRSAAFTVGYDQGKDSFTFHTKGYGHGVGMSQYGADYLARQGKTYEEILKQYYTGIDIISINS